MWMLVTKYAVTAFVVVAVSEIAKRSDKVGALIASLPLVTLMVMIWLHLEDAGTEKIANHAWYTFWYVLPTLPMFVLMPWLLYRGMAFWPALGLGVVVTVLAFVATAFAARHVGVDLML